MAERQEGLQHRAGRPTRDNRLPRLVTLGLGVWLFISAFVWPHTPASQTNAWIVGVLIAAVALAAFAAPVLRFANTVAAAWLFASALWLPHVYKSGAWHDGILAIVVFGLSLIPPRSATTLDEPAETVISHHREAHV